MTNLLQEAQSPETTNERFLEIIDEANHDDGIFSDDYLDIILEIFRNPNCEDFEVILNYLDGEEEWVDVFSEKLNEAVINYIDNKVHRYRNSIYDEAIIIASFCHVHCEVIREALNEALILACEDFDSESDLEEFRDNLLNDLKASKVLKRKLVKIFGSGNHSLFQSILEGLFMLDIDFFSYHGYGTLSVLVNDWEINDPIEFLELPIKFVNEIDQLFSHISPPLSDDGDVMDFATGIISCVALNKSTPENILKLIVDPNHLIFNNNSNLQISQTETLSLVLEHSKITYEILQKIISCLERLCNKSPDNIRIYNPFEIIEDNHDIRDDPFGPSPIFIVKKIVKHSLFDSCLSRKVINFLEKLSQTENKYRKNIPYRELTLSIILQSGIIQSIHTSSQDLKRLFDLSISCHCLSSDDASKDFLDEIMLGLAKNPKSSESLLKILWLESDECDSKTAIQKAILGHPHCPNFLHKANDQVSLEKFCDDLPSESVSAAKAENTPSKKLHQLSENPILALYIAANPATPSDLLETLAQKSLLSVRRRCTAHFNTPKETLLELAKYFPKEFTQNPVFNLLWIENPNLLQNLPKKSLLQLLAEPNLEIDLVQALSQHPDDEVQAKATEYLAR